MASYRGQRDQEKQGPNQTNEGQLYLSVWSREDEIGLCDSQIGRSKKQLVENRTFHLFQLERKTKQKVCRNKSTISKTQMTIKRRLISCTG